MASPGDLAAERRIFKKRIDQLNAGFGDGAGIEFVSVGWEDTLASTGRRVQSMINQDVDECDVFVLALFRRWGQAAPDTEYSAYTEEEFYRALERFDNSGKPEIFVFFKRVDELSMADAGPQLARVLKFRLELEKTHSVRFRIFDDTAGFARELDQHLRAFANGALPPVEQTGLRTPLPLELVEKVERAEAEARQRAETAETQAREERDAKRTAIQRASAFEARALALEQRLAVLSAKAASEGSPEQARQLFAQATLQTTSPDVLNLASELYWRTGPIETAVELLERSAELGDLTGRTAASASAMAKLGVLHQILGSYDRAEAMHRQALEIYQRIRSRTGVSSQYDRLGQIAKDRGDLLEAEALHLQSLAIAEKIGRKEDASNQCTQLALLGQAHGDTDRADEMHRKALVLLASDHSSAAGLDVLTIPVVVHVVHRTIAENISDAQIRSQVAALNRDFRARNRELASTPFPFRPLVGDALIEFRLAAFDPSGRPTAGITRTRTRQKFFDSGDRIKSYAKGGADPWEPEQYLNMWVGGLADGLMGYAQFPGGEAATDGVVMSGKAFGTVGSARAPFNLGRTATHTVAHYFGLHHIWEPEGRLSDVPVQEAANFGAPSFPRISCNNGPFGDLFMNFMDYVDDTAMVMFTKRQVLQMHDALRSSRALLGGHSNVSGTAALPPPLVSKDADIGPNG